MIPPPALRARVLQLLLDGEEWTRAKISRALSRPLPAAGKTFTVLVMAGRGKTGRGETSALDEALDKLEAYKWVSCPRTGVYQITAEGRRIARAHPDRIPDEMVAARGIIRLDPSKHRAAKMAPRKKKAASLNLDDLMGDSEGGFTGGAGLGLGGGGKSLGPGCGGGGGGLAGIGTANPFPSVPQPGLGTPMKLKGPPSIPSLDELAAGDDAGGDMAEDPSPPPCDKMAEDPLPPLLPPAEQVPPAGGLDATLLANPKVVPVWYGTNRKPKKATDEAAGYLSAPDTKMHFGHCLVNVPEGYQRGGSGRGFLGRLLAGEPTKLQLATIHPREEPLFWRDLGATLRKQTSANSLLLFVHGYNVSFKDAANSAGQLSYELQLPVAFFSWSSRNSLFGYGADGDEAEEAVPELKKFITELSTRATAAGKKLHIIAHSMGNRALLRVLHEIALAARPDSPAIAQVIFAAPDVPRKRFLTMLGEVVKLPGLTAGRTLYAGNDNALRGSGVLHVNERAGYLPPVTVAPQLETVDVSRYNLDWLGHSYIFRLAPVVDDIFAVLTGGSSRRRNRAPDGSHWILT